MFPRALKASPLLRAWLRRLAELSVQFRLRCAFRGFDGGGVRFDTPVGPETIEADVVVLALGGASWPRLGANGDWVAPLASVGVTSSPLRPANCGALIDWSPLLREKFEGQPLKNIGLQFGDRFSRGECVVTRRGLEGGGIYALSSFIREALENRHPARSAPESPLPARGERAGVRGQGIGHQALRKARRDRLKNNILPPRPRPSP